MSRVCVTNNIQEQKWKALCYIAAESDAITKKMLNSLLEFNGLNTQRIRAQRTQVRKATGTAKTWKKKEIEKDWSTLMFQTSILTHFHKLSRSAR